MTDLETAILKELKPGWGASEVAIAAMLAEEGIRATKAEISAAVTSLRDKSLIRWCDDNSYRLVNQ